MYLLLSKDENKDEKIIVKTIADMEKYNLNNYKVYGLVILDEDELISEKDIRDEIYRVLNANNNEMAIDRVLDKVSSNLEIPNSKVSKVITKMRKEKLIYYIDYLDYRGKRIIGMEGE